MTILNINLTTEQVEALKAIQTKTRYEALDKVAEILGARFGQRRTWGGTTRKQIIIDANTTADITYSKGKVKYLEFYTRLDDTMYLPYKIN